jgi:hypothetical protein
LHAAFLEFAGVNAAGGAGEDFEVGKMFLDGFDEGDGLGFVVDGDDDEFRVRGARGVEEIDIASMRPAANARRQPRPRPAPRSAMTRTVTKNEIQTRARSCTRSFQRRAGWSSRPSRKIIVTTPNSARCMTSPVRSPTRLNSWGPMITPAIR